MFSSARWTATFLDPAERAMQPRGLAASGKTAYRVVGGGNRVLGERMVVGAPLACAAARAATSRDRRTLSPAV
jgi:hypothetical protein